MACLALFSFNIACTGSVCYQNFRIEKLEFLHWDWDQRDKKK